MSRVARRVSRASHLVSKYSGDLNALQSGGVPRLVQRVARRSLVRTLFRIFR